LEGEAAKQSRIRARDFFFGSTGNTTMPLSMQDFYRSSNGDRWQLVHDTESGRSFVRHEPNLASGGRVTETEVEEFLERTGTSPENLALRALLEKPNP
jgi:hypothetical protein